MLAPLLPFLLLLASARAACSDSPPIYTFIFDFNWSSDVDPAFPNTDPLLDPGFSRLVCASHSANYSMWALDEALTQPMIQFIGDSRADPTPLVDALSNATRAATVLDFSATDNESNSLGELQITLRVSPTHSLISCASQIMPSPAWFIGVSALDMCEDNAWQLDFEERVIRGWWGGLDEAEDYLKSKPIDDPDNPLKVKQLNIVAPDGYGTLIITSSADPASPDTAAQGTTTSTVTKTNSPQVPQPDPAICVDANALRHLPPHALRYPIHQPAYVLCDSFNSCATPGHIVLYHDRPMMMKSYCNRLAHCQPRVMLVNSPLYSRRMRVDTFTHALKFTAFAARFSTKTEEHVLSMAVRMGL